MNTPQITSATSRSPACVGDPNDAEKVVGPYMKLE